MGQIQTGSSSAGVMKEMGPVELGFSAQAIAATGRLPSGVVNVAGYDRFSLGIVTTGGTDVGRAELEFTGYAQDGTTVLIPRTVVLGGAADIFLVIAAPSLLIWGSGITATAFTPPTAATFTAATLGLFAVIPKIKIELNVTTLDAAATVSMFINLLK